MHWCRLYNETAKDDKLRRIARTLNIPVMHVLGYWSAILCAASASPIRGKLMLTDQLPMDTEDLAGVFDVPVTETVSIVSAFENVALVTRDRSDAVCLTRWEDRQPNSDLSTDRVRKHRELKRNETVPETVTPSSNSSSSIREGEGGEEGGVPDSLSAGTPYVLTATLHDLTGRYPSGNDQTARDEIAARKDYDEDTALTALRLCYEQTLQRDGKDEANKRGLSYHKPAIIRALESGVMPAIKCNTWVDLYYRLFAPDSKPTDDQLAKAEALKKHPRYDGDKCMSILRDWHSVTFKEWQQAPKNRGRLPEFDEIGNILNGRLERS